jgi:hypothetical protein
MNRYIMERAVYRHMNGEEFIVKSVAKHHATGEKLVVYQKLRYPRCAKAMPLAEFAARIPEGTESDVNKTHVFELVRERP